MDDFVTKEIPELGPISEILAQDNVEDIFILGPRTVIVSLSDGRQFLSDADFGSHEALMRLVGRIVSREGKQLSTESPFVDASLGDGSRVHISAYPAADPWPQLIIRRHRQLFHHNDDRLGRLIQLGTLTPQAALLLRYAMRAGASILIAGATGAGKSTLISGLGGEIEPLSPVVCIEDTRELDFPGVNVAYLLASPPNPDGSGGISQRFLVSQALRKSPRWIVLGEARGSEAWDFSQAGNTGHSILASVHANGARDAVERYKDMCMEMGQNMEESVVLRSVMRAFRLVVFVERGDQGRRRVVRHIADITGNLTDKNIPVLQDLFVTDGGVLRCTKLRPYPRLEQLLAQVGCNYMNVVQGQDLPPTWMQQRGR